MTKESFKKIGDPGGLGADNIDEGSTEILNVQDRISDVEFWVQDQVAEASKQTLVYSPLTFKLTIESIKENNFLEKPSQPNISQDWGGDTKIIKGKELKKSGFSYGIETGTNAAGDILEI